MSRFFFHSRVSARSGQKTESGDSQVKSAELCQAFLNHTPIEGVVYSHNDYVQIVSGAHEGKCGSLVTVLQLTPEPLFVVELETGFDVEVWQSQIAASGR